MEGPWTCLPVPLRRSKQVTMLPRPGRAPLSGNGLAALHGRVFDGNLNTDPTEGEVSQMTQRSRDREHQDPERDMQRQADFDYDRSRSSRQDFERQQHGRWESGRGESDRRDYESGRPPFERRDQSWGQPVWLEGRRGRPGSSYGRGSGSGGEFGWESSEREAYDESRGFPPGQDYRQDVDPYGYGEAPAQRGQNRQSGPGQYEPRRRGQFGSGPGQWRERSASQGGDPRSEIWRGYGQMSEGRVWDQWAEGEGESFVGRGPKGYKRSDERIREDVCERLTEHPQIDASDFEVKVQGAEVTLIGTVNSRRAKRLAEDVAEQVSGVKDVSNQLRVKEGGSLGTSGHDVAAPGSQPGSSGSRSRSE
jgi:BON domain